MLKKYNFLRLLTEFIISVIFAFSISFSYDYYFLPANLEGQIPLHPFFISLVVMLISMYAVFHLWIKDATFKISCWLFILSSIVSFVAILFSMRMLFAMAMHNRIVGDGQGFSSYAFVNGLIVYMFLYSLHYLGALKSKILYIISIVLIVLPISLVYLFALLAL